MKKMKVLLASVAMLFVANAYGEVKTEPDPSLDYETNSKATVDTAAISAKVQRLFAVFKFNAEVSLSYRQHNVTPIFSYLTFSYEPVNRLKFGVSYINFLGLRNLDGERDYLTSHGIGGSVSYRLNKPKNKDNHGFEVRARYGHSLGNADMKYSLYDIALTCNNDYGIGYRYVDSQTTGIRNSSQVYLSLIF